MGKYVLLILTTFCGFNAAGSSHSDSTKVLGALDHLVSICKRTVDQDMNFREVASYIIYRGEDKSRKWKDVCNYDKQDEKIAVENICRRILGWINENPNYKVIAYESDKESEGEWHAIIVSDEQGKNETVFAFLKIKGQYFLGDID